MSVIDFSRGGRLDPVHLRRLNEIADSSRAEFNRTIEMLGHGHEGDVDWWVSELASRNTYSTPLFTWCCQLKLVSCLIDDQQRGVDAIAMDAWPLFQAVRALVAERRAPLRVTWTGTWRDRMAWWPRVPLADLRYLSEFLFARVVARPRGSLPQVPVTLVDVFVFDESFVRDHYADRYYAEFGGVLEESAWDTLLYWPTLHTSFGRIGTAIRAIRRYRRRFVLTEDIVRLADYAWAFAYPLRAIGLRPASARFGHLDITSMARAVWWRGLTDASTTAGLLKYRFAQRAREQGIQVRCVVDWFENQSVDRGANLGFRAHYPECRIVGYQGYIIPRHYLAMFPTRQEFDSHVLPHSIAVMGPGFVEDRREFCPEIEVNAAPAFRFAGVRRARRYQPDPLHTTVLIPLHMTTGNNIDVLRAVAAAVTAGLPPNTRLWIRPHPAGLPIEELQRLAGVSLQPHERPTGDFTDVLEQADVLVSNASSTALEALAKGVPVAIVAAPNEPAQNSIPADVPAEVWRLCFDGAGVAAAIRDFTATRDEAQARRLAIGRELCERYFGPVTRLAVLELLHLQGTSPSERSEARP